MGFLDGFFSLGKNVNKTKSEESENKEGIASESSGELTLSKSDEELLKLAKDWEDKWDKSDAKKDLERKQKENERYWLGDHYTPSQKATGAKELIDNLIFEAVETFLPAALRQNPEPIVTSDKSPEGLLLVQKVTDRLVDLADTVRLKLKIKKAVRHWAIYYLGCIKLGWSGAKNEITILVKRPQQLILDPDAVTDECEYEGEYLGEYRTDTAEDLITKFPEKAEYIKKEVNEKLGTKIRYIEYWTPGFLFWKLKEEILGKAKNPHWNYDQEIPTEASVDEYGNPVTLPPQLQKGVNHFSSPKVPFAFLSIFNLGKYPFDDTNFIEQVIPLQDVINKRQRQIDKNADNTNGGVVVSGDAFTKEQAKQVADALRKGSTVWVPRGNVNNVYRRDSGSPLPNFVYESLVDYRNELRNIFGTSGLSSQGIKSEETVRGKILIRGTDTDRATPVVDHIEQFVDYIYNWIVQLMVVYYDEPRMVSRSQGSTMISSADFVRPLVVSVKPGSLIPKDRLTQRNEAIDLWGAGAVDPLTLFEKLEFPNPEEAAKRLILWKTNPGAYAQAYAPEAVPVQPITTPEQSQSGGALPNASQAEPAGSILQSVPIQ